jgi:DNA invertase Pin-like site-specific DNA recombinase
VSLTNRPDSNAVPERPLRAAGYVCVSRGDQRPSLQADAITGLVARRQWTLVEVFADHTHAGTTKGPRPELERLMAAARRREFDVVVVHGADRMVRSLRSLIAVLADLAALGVKFVSVTEPFDSTGASGAVLASLVGALASFDQGLGVERTRAGVEAARRRGVRVGRPRVVFNAEEARARLATGEPLAAVARSLGIGATTLRRAMRPSGRTLDLVDAA